MRTTEQSKRSETEQGSLFATESWNPPALILGRIVQLSGPQKMERPLVKDYMESRSLSRSSDPITSKVAGEKTRKFTGKHEAAIYAAVCDSGDRGLTYREIAQETGLEPVAVARRLYAMSTRSLITRHMNEFKEPAEILNGCAVWWKAK